MSFGNQALPGLWPVKAPNGNAPKVSAYTVDSAYGTAIGEGCLLIKTTAGVELAPDAAAVAYGSVIGVAAHNVAASLSEDTEILVYDDPNQVFAIISDGAISDEVIIQGRFCGITDATNVYNSTLGQGDTTLGISTAAATQTTSLPLQIIHVAENVADDATAANVQVWVKIASQHHLFAAPTGVTV